MSASLPKSSPSFNVATVPLPWITTSTDPFSKIYHERPSSPWLNTVFVFFFFCNAIEAKMIPCVEESMMETESIDYTNSKREEKKKEKKEEEEKKV